MSRMCNFYCCFTVLFVLTGAAQIVKGEPLSPLLPLDAGYLQMYNLRFEEAHRTFSSYQDTHPDDPMGPTSEAAAYLFSEFHRLGILRSELFTDDEKFKRMQVGTPDPDAKQEFERALAKGDQLADAVLRQSPGDANALFAKMMDLGMRADYSGLIEKRYLVSLTYVKKAGVLGEQLLSLHPSYYDGYLGLGIENYLLSLRPAPVRWALRLYGAETDKSQGLAKLTVTAEKGHYLLPYARLLLAFAAMRENDLARAGDLLAALSHDFPQNPLYANELARLRN